MNKLQSALRANALFSGLSGIVLILGHQPLARLFGVENATAFWVIGMALVYFAATIVYEIFKQRRLAVLWIIAQDFLWVFGSILLLVWNPFDISVAGLLVIAIVALVVLYMGILQKKALSAVRRHS